MVHAMFNIVSRSAFRSAGKAPSAIGVARFQSTRWVFIFIRKMAVLTHPDKTYRFVYSTWCWCHFSPCSWQHNARQWPRGIYSQCDTGHTDGIIYTKVLEREKQRTLSGEHRKTPHIDGAPGWNEQLASLSEAFVKVLHYLSPILPSLIQYLLKADKHGSTSVDEMQRRTVDYIHTRHSPDDRIGGREATYQRDEVHGPLSDVRGSPDHDDGLLDCSKTAQKTTAREETIEWEREPDHERR